MSREFAGEETDYTADQSKRDVPRALRRLLLSVFLLGVIGTGTELILLDHFEDRLQLIPLILLALGLIAVAWQVISQGRPSVRTLQFLMILFVIGGLVGLVLHYRGSMQFQLEVNPDLSGIELFLKAIRAKAPPALGPGAMIHLGLLGLAYCYRYPMRPARPVKSSS